MRFYLAPPGMTSSEHTHVPAMGVHEHMPPGVIRHGGPGSRHPVLVMLFHTPAFVWPANHQPPVPAEHQLIFWRYEAPHHYGSTQHAWDHTWLHVAGRWIERALRTSGFPLDVPIDLPSPTVAMRYFEMIYDELHGRSRQDPDMLEGILRLFLHDIARHSRPAAGRHHDPRLEQARQFIEANFHRPFDLAAAAQHIHLSPSHFCACFTRQFSVPPREYAMRLRLHRAAQLLANHELAVFQVAQIVGFNDALYFSRMFSKRYGLSPALYRKTRSPMPSSKR